MSTPRPSLIVNLRALTANYRLLQSRRPAAETAAVVKADAYGLGVDRVAPALADAGCRTFFTAFTFEAVTLRSLLAPFGKDVKVCVLNGPDAVDIDAYSEHRLTPVLNTLAQVKLWLHHGRAPAILHVDTAINRLGLTGDEMSKLMADSALTQGLEVSHIMSHFASSSDPASPINHVQMEEFQKIMLQLGTLFVQAKQSLSASAGLFLPFEITEHLTRPGISLYGGGPQDKKEPALETVTTLTAPVLQVRQIGTGEKVGYGGTFKATEPRTIATLGIGYADGYQRHLSNCGQVWLGGKICPVVGAISMDLTTIDVSDCDKTPETGDRAECFGEQLAIEDIAGLAGTISYELLVTLATRVQRIYR